MNKIEVANFSGANPTFRAVVEFIDNKPTIVERFGFEPNKFYDRVAIDATIRLRVKKQSKVIQLLQKKAQGAKHG